MIDAAAHVPQQQAGIKVIFAEVSDPADPPRTEAFDYWPQFFAGPGQAVLRADPVDVPLDDAGAYELA